MADPTKKVVPIEPSLDDSRPVHTLTVGELRQLLRNETARVNKPESADEWVGAERAAAIMGVSPEWIYHNHKKLSFARKVGPKLLRFSLSGLREWMESRKA
jgi:predicted DNA-binding transcriptional regulator AlpA